MPAKRTWGQNYMDNVAAWVYQLRGLAWCRWCDWRGIPTYVGGAAQTECPVCHRDRNAR